jgi:heat shock protein HtpX
MPTGDMGRATPFAMAFGNGIVAHYWPLMLTAVSLWFLISWFFHGHMMRALSHARPVERKDEPVLYNTLENLCISRGLAMPRLEILESDALNAFASGMSEKTYSITVTRGLLNALSTDELEAVLGHELTHIINRDVRLLVVSIIFTGMLGFAAQMIWSNLRYGFIFGGGYGGYSGSYGGSYQRDGRGGGGRGNLMLLLLVVDLILWLGYLATVFTRFALSRRREYMADAGSVELTRNPEGMIRALQKLQGHDRIKGVTEDVALMCISNSRRFLGLFATHPPLEDRIRAIAEITGTPIPQRPADDPPSDDKTPFHDPWA